MRSVASKGGKNHVGGCGAERLLDAWAMRAQHTLGVEGLVQWVRDVFLARGVS